MEVKVNYNWNDIEEGQVIQVWERKGYCIINIFFLLFKKNMKSYIEKHHNLG